MANTLKFGNGIWATKKGSTLAYNSENGNFKPLPFTFDRSTSATRVNKDGLIEVVTNNKPRIDFLNDSNGALLLENSATNLITYSEDFTNASWSRFDLLVTSQSSASPDGTLNADKLIEGTGSSEHYIQDTVSPANGNFSFSVFAKADDYDVFSLRPVHIGANEGNTTNVIFNLTGNGSFSGVPNHANASITKMENGWFRCVVNVSLTGTVTTFLYRINLYNGGYSYTGDGTSGLYIWGAQVEQGSYATSYIPTQGSIGTRVAESCSQTTPSGIIGQTEMTLFFDIKPNATLPSYTQRIVTLYQDSSNLISFQLGSVNDLTFVSVKSGEDPVVISKGAPALNLDSFNKVSVSIKSNRFVFYVNGVKVGQDLTSGKSMPLVSNIIFANYNLAEPFLGNVKELKLYNEALTDAELAALTQV